VIRKLGRNMMLQDKLLLVRFGPKALLKRAGKNDGTSKKLKDSKINSVIHINSPLTNAHRKVSDKPMLNSANEMKRPGDGNSTKTKNGRKNRPKSNGQKNNSVGNDSNKRKKRSTKIGALIRHRKRRDAKKSGISTVRTNTVNTSNNKRKSKRNMRDAWRRPVSTGKRKSRKCGRTIPACNKNSKTL
jgi:hypothetical protein